MIKAPVGVDWKRKPKTIDENARIVAGLKELLLTGDVTITQYEQKEDGYDVRCVQEMERCVKAVNQHV